MIKSLKKTLGIVSHACEDADVGRTTYYQWLKDDEEFKQAVEDIEASAIDHVESKLMEKINGVKVKSKKDVYDVPPSDTAIIFYLKTKGKKRGYSERIEIDNPNESKQQTVIILPSNGRDE